MVVQKELVDGPWPQHLLRLSSCPQFHPKWWSVLNISVPGSSSIMPFTSASSKEPPLGHPFELEVYTSLEAVSTPGGWTWGRDPHEGPSTGVSAILSRISSVQHQAGVGDWGTWALDRYIPLYPQTFCAIGRGTARGRLGLGQKAWSLLKFWI